MTASNLLDTLRGRTHFECANGHRVLELTNEEWLCAMFGCRADSMWHLKPKLMLFFEVYDDDE